jgi:hypothetical protein
MFQIGETFTRLQPAIEFANSAFTPQEGTVSVLGDPPDKFAAVHSPSMLNAWYNKLQDSLERPVQSEQRRGHRRVQVLGTAIFDFASDGSLEVFVWDLEESGQIALKELPAKAVVVQGVPFGTLWMGQYKLGALDALVRRNPGKATLCKAYVHWAHAQLIKSCWDKQTQDRVRYSVAVELDLDMPSVAIASQVQLTTQPMLPLRVSAYNHAIRHRVGYQQLRKEAPQLITLYSLMADKLAWCSFDPAVKETTARIQHYFRKRDVMPVTWRMFCHEGTDWMKEFLAFYDFNRKESCDIALDLLDVVFAFGRERLPPMSLLRAFIQIGGNPNKPQTSYANRLRDLNPLCARLGHLAALAHQTKDEATLALLDERALDIFNWASSHFEKLPAGYARRATLLGILRKVDAHNLHEEMRLKGKKPWPIHYRLYLKSNDVQVVILNSPLAVWEEGRDMRHCAGTYIKPCELGDWLMVSLRRKGKCHALATVAFEMRRDKVSQAVISGFANSLVAPEVHLMAKECMAQLQKQHPLVQMALAA